MDEHSIISQLLTEMDQEWANIERICAGLSEDQMLTHPVPDVWSVKDVLVHLSAWEKLLLDRLGYIFTGLEPHYPPMRTLDDIHRFNAQVYEENKDRPLTSAVIEFRSLCKGVMTALEALTDEQLTQPYTYDFPDDHLTLLQFIRANTIDHYREHCVGLGEDV